MQQNYRGEIVQRDIRSGGRNPAEEYCGGTSEAAVEKPWRNCAVGLGRWQLPQRGASVKEAMELARR